MLIQKQEIRKVFTTNSRNQIAILRSIQQKLSETNDLSLQNQTTLKEFAEIQAMMQRWMELVSENEILIQKYQRQSKAGQLNLKEYQSLEGALATQLYIRDKIEKQQKLCEIYKQQQFILWNALQKYNFRALLAPI